MHSIYVYIVIKHGDMAEGMQNSANKIRNISIQFHFGTNLNRLSCSFEFYKLR